MIDKRFMLPGTVKAWCIVVFERQQRFNDQNCKDMVNGIRTCAKNVGITGFDTNPHIKFGNGQANIMDVSGFPC
jgi:eukaryotic translation initiation factor 2C